MGLIAGGLGLAGSLAGMFGSDTADNVQLPPTFNMPNMGDAANSAFSSIPGLSNYNAYSQVMPQAGQTAQSLYNNPYAQLAQGGSLGAAGMGMGGAVSQFQQGQSLYPYAQQILQTGFDPQNALYDRTQQQLTDQVRTGQAARGLGNSPYGAGLEDQAMSNFNIDWQNNQLSREATAGGAASSMIGQGAALSGSAPGQFAQASQYPYATFQGQGTNQLGALNQYGNFGAMASVLPQQQIQDYLSYLGTGNQAGGVANQTAGLGLQQNQLAFNQNQTLGQNLGASLYGLGNATGGGVFGYPGGSSSSSVPYSTGGFVF